MALLEDSDDAWFKQQQQGLIQSPSAFGGMNVARGGTGVPNPNSPIYMGRGDILKPGGPMGPPVYGDKIQPYEEVRLMPMHWDDATMRKFVNTGVLNKIPGFDVGMGLPEIVSAWEDMVQSSYALSTSARKVSPWDIMSTYGNSKGKFGTIRKGDWEYDVATGEKVKYVGPRSKTTTQKRVDLSSPEEARALTNQMLTELLGRAPTAEEMARYRSAINSYEQANPEVATTTVQINEMGEETSSSTTSVGGASQAALGQIISEQAKQGPEYGKVQSGTTYYNAFLQLLGG